MADEKDITREIWDGRIPVQFVLSSNEKFSSDDPEPLMLMVSRVSYFPLIYDKLQKHFTKYINHESIDELWLEHDGQPLKWHYPIGLLFDLFAHDTQLPWTIVVHFEVPYQLLLRLCQNFPAEELLRCPSKDAVESHFMSTLKEADALKHRSKVMNNLQKKDHKLQWSSLLNAKFDQFWSVNRKLMERVDGEAFRLVPFRLYQKEQHFIQLAVNPIMESGEDLPLRSLIHQCLPEGTGDEKVVCHGISIPLETPLHWLSEHLSYPDNFLHLVLFKSSNDQIDAQLS